MDDTTKLINEQFETLPLNLQHAISKTPWKEIVQDIAKNQNLSSGESSSLETETMLVIYGFESENDFVTNIIESVGVSEEKAVSLSKLVEEKILTPIVESSNAERLMESPTLSKILQNKKPIGDWSNKGFSPNIDLSKQIEEYKSELYRTEEEAKNARNDLEYAKRQAELDADRTIIRSPELIAAEYAEGEVMAAIERIRTLGREESPEEIEAAAKTKAEADRLRLEYKNARDRFIKSETSDVEAANIAAEKASLDANEINQSKGSGGNIPNFKKSILMPVSEKVLVVDGPKTYEGYNPVTSDQLKKIPPELGEAISKVDWKRLVKSIAYVSGLTLEQSKKLEDEVMILIYNFESRDNFLDNIEKNVGVNEDKAEKLAGLIENKIILEISKKFELVSSKKELQTQTPNLFKRLQNKKPMGDLDNKVFSPNIDLSKQIEIEPAKKIILLPDLHQHLELAEVKEKTLTPLTIDERSGPSLSPLKSFVPLAATSPEAPKLTPIVPVVKDTRYAGGIDPYREQI